MPMLNTPPDRHGHQHEHAPAEPPAAPPSSPAPRHTHQPHMPGGRTPGGSLGDLHHHPKGTINTIDLVRASITVVYVTLPQNAGPSSEQGTPHPLPTTSRLASIPPLQPVPADGTNSGTHSAKKQRHENSLRGLQKAAPPTHPSDTALHTHRWETRTRPPGDGPSPTANPATSPK